MKSCENQKRSSGCAQVVRRKALLQKHLYWQCTFLFFTSIVTYVKSGACFGITWVICRLRLDVKLLFRDIPLYSWTRFCVSRLLTPLSASCSNMYFKLLTYTNITSFSFFSSIFSFVYFPLCSPFSLMICTSLYVCIEWSHSTRLRLAQWPHLDCAGPLRGWRWQGRQGQCKIDWKRRHAHIYRLWDNQSRDVNSHDEFCVPFVFIIKVPQSCRPCWFEACFGITYE